MPTTLTTQEEFPLKTEGWDCYITYFYEYTREREGGYMLRETF
ncbi:hypothetical protein C5S53_00720 [Methanophagales archaeon]|nr:hypothetical protein C5S53_00720 [Methanophagales archaeon]